MLYLAESTNSTLPQFGLRRQWGRHSLPLGNYPTMVPTLNSSAIVFGHQLKIQIWRQAWQPGQWHSPGWFRWFRLRDAAHQRVHVCWHQITFRLMCHDILDLGGRGEPIAYPWALIEYLLRSRQSWTWELVEASKSWLPILLLVVYTNWNLTHTTRQGSRVSWLA